MRKIIPFFFSIENAEMYRAYYERRERNIPVESEFENFTKPTILVDEPKKMKQRGLDLLNRKR